MQNEIAYSRPVTLTNILRFAVPTIAMSVFMSFYTMVDGLFVSNLIGTSALSALNLVYPVIALVTAISTMLATGGSAAIMRKMGEGKPDEAKQDFTFLILVNVLTGLVMCGLGYLFMGKIFGSMSLSPEVSAASASPFPIHCPMTVINTGPIATPASAANDQILCATPFAAI